MQLSDQLQLESTGADSFAPDVDHTTRMARQYQFTL
jgi:hypothetical protein